MPTKYPPALSLTDAIRVINVFYEIHRDQQFNLDSIDPDILDTKKTSSYFNRRISALQAFGLLEKRGDLVRLTPLACQIAHPVAGEDSEAKLTAFRKVDVLAELLARYPNAKLPAASDTLKQVLWKLLGVERERVNEWYEFAVNSFGAISPVVSDGSPKSESPIGMPVPPPSEMKVRFRLPLPSGGTFVFDLEKYTEADLGFLIDYFTLLKNNIKAGS